MSSVAQKIGFQTVTLDNDPKTCPDILTDILTWDYRDVGRFDYIHASIPCDQFSRCHTRGERNLPLASSIADKTREIIEYFFKKLNSRCLFTIENPATSLLNQEAAVDGLAYSDASYCAYGYPYRKNTRFWHNFPRLVLKTCTPEHCFWGNKAHAFSVQDAPPDMRARIPACLCFEILTTACQALSGRVIGARIPLRPMPKRTAVTTARRGRPKTTTDNVECSVCGIDDAKFYNLTSSEPIMCSRCYRRTRRHAKSRSNDD